MRMALDLGLHRALEKLAEDSNKRRPDEEERDLGRPILVLLGLSLVGVDHAIKLFLPVSGCVSIGSTTSNSYSPSVAVPCTNFTPQRLSLETGRPIVLRDETSIKHCRLLLKHRMMSITDVRLISQVELIAQKSAFTAGVGRSLSLKLYF